MTKPSVWVLGLAFLAMGASAQPKPTAVTGTWRFTEIRVAGQNPRTISHPQGLMIFTGSHFSWLYIGTDAARVGLQDQTKASAAELLAVWGPVVAAAGTYTISGNQIVVHPEVAKNPQVMAPGRTGTYSFKLEGSKLTLTDVGTNAGPATAPRTITMTRVE